MSLRTTLTRRVKTVLGRLMFGLGLHRSRLRGRAVVALFHRVDARYAGNPISCTPDEFERYLRFFKSHFTVVPLAELLDRLARREDVSGLLAITFDDGYRDNHATAAPALKRAGLPATFYIATGFIGSDRVPWWDEERQIRSEWMDWDQVRDLARQGFELGAHTINHVDLGVVTGDEARQEIAESRATLERETAAPVTTFTYPYGRRHQITEANRAAVGAAGYRACLSAYGGLVAAGDDPYRLQRVPISPWHLSPYQFGFEILQDAEVPGLPSR